MRVRFVLYDSSKMHTYWNMIYKFISKFLYIIDYDTRKLFLFLCSLFGKHHGFQNLLWYQNSIWKQKHIIYLSITTIGKNKTFNTLSENWSKKKHLKPYHCKKGSRTIPTLEKVRSEFYSQCSIIFKIFNLIIKVKHYCSSVFLSLIPHFPKELHRKKNGQCNFLQNITSFPL